MGYPHGLLARFRGDIRHSVLGASAPMLMAQTKGGSWK
jgi:hypothetical protein